MAAVKLPKSAIASKARLSNSGSTEGRLQDSDITLLNESVKVLRQADPIRAIRALTRFNGVFSTAVHSYVQLAMSGYTVTGYCCTNGTFSQEATQAGKALMASADTLHDYTQGYSDKPSMNGFLETLLKEVVQTGAAAAELVVNKSLLPERMVPISVPTIAWNGKKDGTKYPVQTPANNAQGFVLRKVGTNNSSVKEDIKLDYPNVFYAGIQEQAGSPFARSPMEPALQNVFVFAEFVEDIYKILKKYGHNRMVVSLIQEKIQQAAPEEAKADPKKMITYLNSVRAEVEAVVAGLEPDEALIIYDTATVDNLSTAGEKADYTALLDNFSGMLATSLKTMPSILGMRIGGSQSLSNTESLIYLKQVASIQTPVETIMSRMLTLSMRLMTGVDGYIKFNFNPINLRPEAELSAHRSVYQQNIFQELSVGMITDEEAAHLLGRGPRAEDAPKLSGTFFMDASMSTHPTEMNDNSGAQERTMSEGTSRGSATSRGGGSN